MTGCKTLPKIKKFAYLLDLDLLLDFLEDDFFFAAITLPPTIFYKKNYFCKSILHEELFKRLHFKKFSIF